MILEPRACPACKGSFGFHRRMGGLVCNGCRVLVLDQAGQPPIGARWILEDLNDEGAGGTAGQEVEVPARA